MTKYAARPWETTGAFACLEAGADPDVGRDKRAGANVPEARWRVADTIFAHDGRKKPSESAETDGAGMASHRDSAHDNHVYSAT
jgi:hypothetical protein